MTSTIRAKRELKKCSQLENFEIDIPSDNILEWQIIFSPQTDVFKKSYVLKLKIPVEYPFKAPSINFTDYIFHPNIDRKGNMCIGILTEWKPSFTIESVLEAVHSQFIEPELSNPINIEAAKLWEENIEQYIKKVN